MKKEEEERGAKERRQYDRSDMKRKQNKGEIKRDGEETKGNVIEGGNERTRYQVGGVKNKIREARKGRGETRCERRSRERGKEGGEEEKREKREQKEKWKTKKKKQEKKK